VRLQEVGEVLAAAAGAAVRADAGVTAQKTVALRVEGGALRRRCTRAAAAAGAAHGRGGGLRKWGMRPAGEQVGPLRPALFVIPFGYSHLAAGSG
jgi:hypothetical protein